MIVRPTRTKWEEGKGIRVWTPDINSQQQSTMPFFVDLRGGELLSTPQRQPWFTKQKMKKRPIPEKLELVGFGFPLTCGTRQDWRVSVSMEGHG